ncbi:MAG: DsbA family protein [Aggregatilineales bacterium]
MKLLRGVLVIALLMMSVVALAQDEDSDDSEFETTPVGALRITHPVGWYVIQGQQGGVIFANINLLETPPVDFPPDTVLAQVSIADVSALVQEDEADLTPTELLERIPGPDTEEPPVIEEIEIDDLIMARAEANTELRDNTVYLRMMTEQSFAFAVVASAEPGGLAAVDDTVQQILASMTIDLAAPFAENPSDPYDGVERGFTEEGFPALGDPNAPIRIDKISSFDCTSCRAFHDFSFEIVMEKIRSGDVYYVYVPVFGTGLVSNGGPAALTALCAGQQGQFWEFHDALFEWQDFGSFAFLPERLDAGAEALSLDLDAFRECIADENLMTEVISTAQTFANNTPGFFGTPTILLNGESINWNPDALQERLDSEIAALDD